MLSHHPRLFANGGFGTIPVDKFPLRSRPSLNCHLEIASAAPIPAALFPSAPIPASLIPGMIPASPKPAALIRVREQVHSHLGACSLPAQSPRMSHSGVRMTFEAGGGQALAPETL
jgi:hypothetical protein